ncbi:MULTISPECIES: hypothetical protein [unclassified Variovorax]|uniref:hypothetical protein n=1 Tax=unclassified Variovorax TaxID=663243 RepID=UPI0011AEF210|nr:MULTISPECIES: hypothetical protein [unclassified Variovorax]
MAAKTQMKRCASTLVPGYIYEAENISSNLATPVVEAVARQRPKKIHIVACPHAPPQRIMQFEDELDARLQVDFILSLSEEVCESNIAYDF